METESEMSMLKLMFGTPPRNKKLVVPRNIPLEELRRKVAEKFDLPESQPFKLLVVPADFPPDKLNERAVQTSELEIVVFKPFILECYDELDFEDWIEVDEGDYYELPPKGKAKILMLQPSTASPVTQTITTGLPIKLVEKKRPSTPDSGALTPSDSKKLKSSQSSGDDKTTDTNGGKETELYPMCGSAPVVPSVEVVPSLQPGAAAHVSKGKVWEERQSLKVHFMNPDDIMDPENADDKKWGWRCRGEPMNINTIFAWARVWNFVGFEEIPTFEFVEIARRADIRVKFSNTGGNWSVVGMEATNITDLEKPTMQLNLGGHTPDLQESLVVHEFGHALGLEHEHQSSDFWDVLEKHLDVNEMKKDPLVGAAWDQWAKKSTGGQSVNDLSEYDPDSIMHYRFKINWIVGKALQTYENIDKDLHLTDKERKYLKALHDHSKKGQLSKRPTLNDYKVLAKAYGCTFDENSLDGRKLQELIQNPPEPVVGPKGKVLGVNTHLRAIRNAVWPMSAYWRNLGVELLITSGSLDAIDADKRDSGAKLGAVLEKWMHTGKATTGDLISALRSVSVLRGDLADEILSHKDTRDAAKYGF